MDNIDCLLLYKLKNVKVTQLFQDKNLNNSVIADVGYDEIVK